MTMLRLMMLMLMLMPMLMPISGNRNPYQQLLGRNPAQPGTQRKLGLRHATPSHPCTQAQQGGSRKH